MITEPTVFILGAGASHPYGLPLGTQLADGIINALAAGRHEAVANYLGGSKNELIDFASELKRARLGTIDNFLRTRAEFLDIGKICIAQQIIQHETPEWASDWYDIIWHRMHAGAKNLSDFAKNSVTFLTFNYDRSLEGYFEHVIRSAFGNADKNILWSDALQAIPIIHLHGQVGFLNWQSPNADGRRSFGPMNGNMPEEMWKAAQRLADKITVMSEADANLPAMVLGRRAIAQARHIVFLGMGYHKENLRNLSQNTILTNKCWGNVLHNSIADERLRDPKLNGFGHTIEPIHGNAQDFLKKDWPFWNN